MYWNGYIEKVGTGTEDIITKCHDYGLQTPEFHQEEDFRVVIWRNKSETDPNVIQIDPNDVRSDVRNDVRSDVRNVESTIGKEESVILNMMRSNPSVTAMLISQELKLSLRSIQRYMTSLREKGLIRREGSTKRGKWIVIGN